MWLVHFYWILEADNLWKATVAFFVTLVISVTLTACLRPWRAWKAHRRTQETIADRLNTSTPGGLTDLVEALRELQESLEKGEVPDDNGSDVTAQARKIRHGSRMPGGVHGIHGGGSAGHH